MWEVAASREGLLTTSHESGIKLPLDPRGEDEDEAVFAESAAEMSLLKQPAEDVDRGAVA